MTSPHLPKLRLLLVENFDVQAHEVELGSILVDDLQLDAVDLVDLDVMIEDSFGIDIPDELTGKNGATVQTILDYLDENVEVGV